ncbi:MAG: ABC transporter permease subunit [Candidatus Promineifilaceae bacterium]|nr:ABC transporter permease subunit [Candidatus Promineifilaceae bacterium]
MMTLIFSQLTIREAQRRRILWVGLLMGFAFLALFGIAFHFVFQQMEIDGTSGEQREILTGVMLTAGLYATNLLVTIMAVLISVTTISGEIESHTIESLVTKPVHRWQPVLGKWLAFALLLVIYVVFLAGGLMLVVYLRSGFLFQNIFLGLSMIVLQSWIVLSVSIAGGTRLSTLANGVLAFALYSFAFLGGWVEQIGALFRNEAAVNIGIFTSLLMPGDILWKKALVMFQPRFASTPYLAGPFAVSSQPSDMMIIYALIYTFGLLALAMWSFTRRDL